MNATGLLPVLCQHTQESPLCDPNTAWHCVGYGLPPCEAAAKRKADLEYRTAQGEIVPLGVESAPPGVGHGGD
jgi:hypothetical protein